MTSKFFPLVSLLCAGAVIPLAAAPPWVDRKPADTPATVYFRALAEADAREAAERAAINSLHAEAARYILVSIRAADREDSRTVQRGAEGVISEQYIAEFRSEIESYTDLLVSGIKTELHSEQYAGSSGRTRWRAWALGAASRQELDRERAEYPKRISAQYSSLLTSGGSLAADLRSRQAILQALDKNPLHKAVAVFDTPQGRVNLYDYIAAQISAWAGGLVLGPIPAQKARKGETLRIPIQARSPAYPSLGQLEYRVSVFRVNSTVPALTYTVTGGGDFSLPLSAAGLETAGYTVQIAPAFARVPGVEFPLEVSAINASLRVVFSGDLPENFGPAEQNRARETLRQAVRQGIQQYHLPITLGADGAYQFTVTADMQKFPALTRCALTLVFGNGNEALAQSKSQNRGDRDLNLLFGRFIREAIVNDQAFFMSVNKLFE
jgi:hypothetical protein